MNTKDIGQRVIDLEKTVARLEDMLAIIRPLGRSKMLPYCPEEITEVLGQHDEAIMNLKTNAEAKAEPECKHHYSYSSDGPTPCLCCRK